MQTIYLEKAIRYAEYSHAASCDTIRARAELLKNQEEHEALLAYVATLEAKCSGK
jgi:hypothetical protein